MTATILTEHRRLWREKPVLRTIYEDYYRRIIAACRPDLSLEIGGGSGNLKAYLRGVISTDIVPAPWLDAAADAQALPFRDDSFVNIVAVDVLHHIERPVRFLAEAERTLQPGGRLILMEPAITPMSRVFYRCCHLEPVDMTADPLADGPLATGRQPFDANQAIPTLLFGRHRERFRQRFPALKLVQSERLSFFAYPLSGGFRSWSLIPAAGAISLLKVESALAPLLGWVMAFRMFVVVEKT